MSRRNAFARVGEYGFTFQLKTDYASNEFTQADITFTKPDGSISTKTCDDSDGGQGEWGWVVTEDFFDTAGWWYAELTITLSAGVRKSIRKTPFLVGSVAA